MRRWLAAAPLTLIAVAGCLATKGDIRLIQDEFRATRSQIGVVDTSVARANEQRRQQIATLSANIERLAQEIQRTNDSLRVLAARFAAFQGTANGEFDAIGRSMVEMRALLGANTRSLQDARAQFEQLKEAREASVAPQPAATTSSGSTTVGPPPGTPGAATLFTSGREALANGAYNTARSSFNQLLTAWPNSDEAPRALLFIGESYATEGNKVAADSVYQLVPTRFPKSDAAATALYRRAQTLVEAKRNAEARDLLDRVVKDYPSSDAAVLARDLLRNIR